MSPPNRRPSLFILASLAVLITHSRGVADDSAESGRQVDSPQSQAALLVQRTIERLALGDAFDAKLRQRLWVGGREVVGIGHYEQSGGGTGRFSLEMTIHDGDSRQSMRQISDGKLAWIRTQLGESVTLQRVDLGRIDEVYREATRPSPGRLTRSAGYAQRLPAEESVPPWMRVGGLVELVNQIATDFDLRIGKGTVDERPVWILKGSIRDDTQKRIDESGGRSSPAPLCPSEVRVAIAAVGDASGFGVGLPLKIEFWSKQVAQPVLNPDPKRDVAEASTRPGPDNQAASQADDQNAGEIAGHLTSPRGRLISLLEIYAIRPIQPSPEERFRFKRDDPDVIFTNDTRRYLDRIAPPR